MRLREIVVPVDFSLHSERALERAVGLAKAFGGHLHLIHSYAVPVQGVLPYDFAVPDSVWESIRQAAAERLEVFGEKAAAVGVPVSTELSAEAPVEAIAKAAGARGADLVVMGTHGHSGLKHVLLGSVAERTIRAAPCWVLAVKDDGGAPGGGTEAPRRA